MKKILSALLALVIVLALPALALSENAQHTIGSYDISLEIPEGYRLITPDIAPDDPLLAVYGLTKEDVHDMFAMMPLFMDAVKTDGSGEITITIQESELPDYADLGYTTLEALSAALTEDFAEMGVDILASDIYAHPQMPFARAYFQSELLADSGVQYYTVWGGHSYSFALHSYTDTLPEADADTMEAFMESVRFNAYEPKPIQETEPISFTNDELGLSFTVPSGWQEADVDQKSGVIQSAYTAVKDPACNIVYVGSDIWNEYSPLQKLFLTRSAVDNSSTTKWEVAQMFGASASDAELVTINGTEYFRVKYSQTVSQYGLTVKLTSTALVCMRDAKCHMFLFTGGEHTGLEPAFDALMETVSYSGSASRGPAPIVYILALMAAAGIAVAIIVPSRVRKRRRAAEAANSTPESGENN